jgi:hypothetical protein
MRMALGPVAACTSLSRRDAELVGRGMPPIEAHVALARHACPLCHALLRRHQAYNDQRHRQQRHRRGR